MMRHANNERGALPVLAVILVAVLIVAAGVAVYSANKSQQKPQAIKNSPSPSASPTLAATLTPTPSPTKPTNEFDVPELGFKMTLLTGLSGLKYSVELNQTGTVDGQTYIVSTARFSTQSLEQADSKNCSATTGPIGAISKYTFDPTGRLMDLGKVVRVGDSYLALSNPQAECSPSAAANSIQSAMWPLLSQAFNSAVPL